MIWVFAFVFASMHRGCRVWHNISHIPCTWKKIVQRLFSGIVDDDDDEMTRWTRQHTLRHISLNNFTLQKLYPHSRRHGKICEMRQKKPKFLRIYFFFVTTYHISLFSYSFVAFRFRNFVCHHNFPSKVMKDHFDQSNLYSEADFFFLSWLNRCRSVA